MSRTTKALSGAAVYALSHRDQIVPFVKPMANTGKAVFLMLWHAVWKSVIAQVVFFMAWGTLYMFTFHVLQSKFMVEAGTLLLTTFLAFGVLPFIVLVREMFIMRRAARNEVEAEIAAREELQMI